MRGKKIIERNGVKQTNDVLVHQYLLERMRSWKIHIVFDGKCACVPIFTFNLP